jgi:threonine/homoserine/homoserine lactone efflux protein
MTLASFAAFAGLCVLLSVTPGPDTFLVLRFSMTRRAAGIFSGVGSSVGTIVWAALVAVGLATLLEQSAEVYRVVKIVGGLYLVYLGVSTFIRTRKAHVRSAESALQTVETRPVHGGIVRPFASGLLSTMLNPKVGLFFLAIVPQFVPAHSVAAGWGTVGWTLALGATEAVIGGVYLAIVAVLASRAVQWLKRPAVTKWLERISSGVLAALGIGTIALAAQE